MKTRRYQSETNDVSVTVHMNVRQGSSSSTIRIRRVANGAARQRIQVALPESILSRFISDARTNMRSYSAQAAVILVQHYESQEQKGA